MRLAWSQLVGLDEITMHQIRSTSPHTWCSIFLYSIFTILGNRRACLLNLDVCAFISEPFIVRFHSSCSIFYISSLGQYSSINNSFNYPQDIAFAVEISIVFVWSFHQVKETSKIVQAANRTCQFVCNIPNPRYKLKC